MECHFYRQLSGDFLYIVIPGIALAKSYGCYYNGFVSGEAIGALYADIYGIDADGLSPICGQGLGWWNYRKRENYLLEVLYRILPIIFYAI